MALVSNEDFLAHLAATGGASIGGVVASGTQGSVLYVGAGGALAQDNANFFYDDTDHQLVLGAGTVGKPSLIFGDDTTGLYRPGANQVGVSISGSLASAWGVAPTNQDLVWGAGRLLSDARFPGELTLSHAALTTTANYFLRLNAAGSPVINSAAGQIIKFAIGAVQKWAINATGSDFSPASDNANDIGLTATRVRRQFLAEYFEMSEMTAPAAPGVDKGRLFLQDNGAGKTQLMIIFNTGVAQQIAIQP